MLEQLFELQKMQLRSNVSVQKRYLYNQINWTNRLIIVVGMRGVGKTTLLLQYIKEKYGDSEEALYVSADNILINQIGLFNTAVEFEKLGGKFLVVDEIHKYPNWNQELKNIYDSLPNLRLAVSGSSSIGITRGRYDLSRRAIVYTLAGLSFREFINFKLGETVFDEVLTLDNLFSDIKSGKKISRGLTRGTSFLGSTKYTGKIVKNLRNRNQTVLSLFKEYLRNGYYPYFLEGESEYLLRVNNAISKVIYEDIPAVFNTNREATNLMQKIIYMVASSSPFSPNIAGIASDLSLAKESVYLYLDYLQKAGILAFLFRSAKVTRAVRKPEKVYLENPNLFYAIESAKAFTTNVGAIREAFALSQLLSVAFVTAPENYDFLVDGKYIVEIGGPSKDQIKTAQKVYVFKDGLEYGSGTTLPLWLLGFLY